MKNLARPWWRHALVAMLMAAIVGVLFSYYRIEYNHAKRLRIVTDGKMYRSGQLTANGFREAFHRFGIKTVINLQEEARDPFLPPGWQQQASELESDVCRNAGVEYISMDGGVLEVLNPETSSQPKLIEDFFAICRQPERLPILIHCKAGLHRTGFMTAIYRMEFEQRSKADVVRELRANGFGTFGATSGNDYMQRYILDFRPSFMPKPPREKTK
jgi:tyrosine-protein phosphatase SIW14